MEVQEGDSHRDQLLANKRLESTHNTNTHAEHVKDLKKTNTLEEREFKT